jgi:hypothetical protein
MEKETIIKMYTALKKISQYDSPAILQKTSQDNYGLNYDEAIEMAYEDIIYEAK